MAETKYCKYCGTELTDSNWNKVLKEADIRICMLCYMNKNSLEDYDKTIAKNLNLLEKLGFNRNYILTHFFTYGNTYDKEEGNYFIWTYKAEQGVLKGAVLELWLHNNTLRKTASLYLPSGQKYIKITMMKLEQILNELARRYL